MKEFASTFIFKSFLFKQAGCLTYSKGIFLHVCWHEAAPSFPKQLLQYLNSFNPKRVRLFYSFSRFSLCSICYPLEAGRTNNSVSSSISLTAYLSTVHESLAFASATFVICHMSFYFNVYDFINKNISSNVIRWLVLMED